MGRQFDRSAALRAGLLAGAAFLIASGQAFADEADAAAGGGGGGTLDEIVVTAQKRATNLQNTPIAISVQCRRSRRPPRPVAGGSGRRLDPVAACRALLRPQFGADRRHARHRRAGRRQPAGPRPGRRRLYSTASISAAPRALARRSTTSSASKCSRGRRAPCSAATPRAARSASSPRSRPACSAWKPPSALATTTATRQSRTSICPSAGDISLKFDGLLKSAAARSRIPLAGPARLQLL